MAAQLKICPGCFSQFHGRPNAKACSDRCRKRLHRAKQLLSKEVDRLSSPIQQAAETLQAGLTAPVWAPVTVIAAADAPLSPAESPEPVEDGLNGLDSGLRAVTATSQPQTLGGSQPAAGTAEVGPATPAPAPGTEITPPANQNTTQQGNLASNDVIKSTNSSPVEPISPTIADLSPSTRGPLLTDINAAPVDSSLEQAATRPANQSTVLTNPSLYPAQPDTGMALAADEPPIKVPRPKFKELFHFRHHPLAYSLSALAIVLVLALGIFQKVFYNPPAPPGGLSSVSDESLTLDPESAININRKTIITDGNSFLATGDSLVDTSSVAAFAVQNASGSQVLVVDTENGRVGVGGAPTGQAALQIFGDLMASGSLAAGGGASLLSDDGLTINGQQVCTAAGCLATTEISPDQLPPSVTLQGNSFNGASELVQLTAAGALPALSGVNLTNVNAARLNGQTGGYYTNASNINSGTLNDARLSTNVTLQGNSFNGASQLVQTTGSGALPVLSGVNLTNLDASNISAGTLLDARLSNNVALLNGTGPQTFTGNNRFNGTILHQNAVNSTTALQIQNSAGSSNLFIADTTNSRIGIGTVPTLGTLDVNGDIYQNGNQVCDTSGNCAGGSGDILNNGQNGPVTIGTNDATALNFETNNNTVQSFTSGGAVLFQNSANSTTAFQIQDSAGTSDLFIADTTNSRIAIAQASASYTLDVAGDVNTTGVYRINGTEICTSGGCTPVAGSDDYVQLQGATPGSPQTGHLNISGTAIAGTFSGSGASLTSLNGSNISSGTVADARLSANVALLNGTGPQTFTGNNRFNGTILHQNAANSTTAFQIQDAAGTSNLFNADTTNSRIGIGMNNPSYTLDVAGDINITGVYRVGGVAICGGSGCTPEAGSNNYIQLQGASPGSQQTGNFNISGTGIAATALKSPGLDAASVGTLALGDGGTATVVSICNSANCDTVQIATNADADAIQVGDANDTTTILGTVNINTTGAATTTIGASSNTNLILQDSQWTVTGAGVATFASVSAGSGDINTSGTVSGNNLDRTTAGALTIGSNNTTSVVICNTANCDTVSIGTNADADAINIGDASDTITFTGGSGSTFVINGTTVSATEFNRLDGKDAALVDTNDAVTTAITGTGALDAGSITSGFGAIDTGADNISTTGTVNGNTFDRTSAGTITIGGTATAITLEEDTTIADTKALVLSTTSAAPTATQGAIYYDLEDGFVGYDGSNWLKLVNYADVKCYVGSGSVSGCTTSSGTTMTVPAGVGSIQIVTIGGGGGGGGAQSNSSGSNKSGAAGGGGGAYTSKIISASEISAISSTLHITPGAGGSSGTGGTAGDGTAGGVGGTSCVSSSSSCGGTVYLRAYGGGGGGGGVNNGGAGGGGGGGTIGAGVSGVGNGNAGAGGSPQADYIDNDDPAVNRNSTGCRGGSGGNNSGCNSFAGGGAGGGNRNQSNGAGGNAEYGGGGGGGANSSNNASASGGSSIYGGGGGGGGAPAGSATAGTAAAGGASGSFTAGGGGAAGSGSAGTAGAAGNSIKAGNGGGGGAGVFNGAGFNGGAGGACGGGGGGGGAAGNNAKAGDGGEGGAGCIWIISW